MSKRVVIGLWALLALMVLAALATTVLNRAWWARRINARWNVFEVTPPDPNAPPGFDKPTFTKVKFDDAKARQYGLVDLMALYFKGEANWQRYE